MSQSPQSILFLSGAGLPAWIWDDVRRVLADACDTQVAPRPTGSAAGPRDYAEAALASVPTGRFTLVAHSAGGVVGTEIARLAPDRVAGLLAISAIVPEPGGSFIGAMPLPNRWILSIAMRLSGTRPPDSAIRGTLAHGLDQPVIDRLVADFTPEPLEFYRGRTGTTPWSCPTGYLRTTRDRELPPTLQDRFADRLGARTRQELATGHLPMIEDPAGVAAAITGFLAQP
ncbi:alpha/beta fold hydrolase [Salana multivorans]